MKHLAYLLLIVYMVACKPSVPEGVLPTDKMQALYWDLMRADEMVNYYALLDTAYVRTKHQDSLYTAIFGIHQVSRETFLKSKSYYETHPEKLKPILDSIHSRGEKIVNAIDLPEQGGSISETGDDITDKGGDTLPTPQIDTTPKKIIQPDTTRRRKGLILQKAN